MRKPSYGESPKGFAMFAAVSMAGGNFGFISNSGYDTMRYQSFLLHLKYLMPLQPRHQSPMRRRLRCLDGRGYHHTAWTCPSTCSKRTARARPGGRLRLFPLHGHKAHDRPPGGFVVVGLILNLVVVQVRRVEPGQLFQALPIEHGQFPALHVGT